MNCLGRIFFSFTLSVALSVLFLFPSAYANHLFENGLSGKVRLVQEELPSTSPALSAMTRETTYAPNGKIIRVASFVNTAPYSEKTYRYDGSGHLMLISKQTAQGWQPETAYQYSGDCLKKTYCYGPDGKLLEAKTTSSVNKGDATYSIEKQGNTSSIYRLDADGQRYLSASYEYENAVLFQKKSFYPNGILASSIIFDKQQHPILIYQYDRQGNLLLLEQIRYRLDANGNWLEKTTERLQNGIWQEPVILKRTLSYY